MKIINVTKEDGTSYDLKLSYRLTTRKLFKNKTGKDINSEIQKVGEEFDKSGFLDVQKAQAEGKEITVSMKQGLGILTSDYIIDFLVNIFPCLYVNDNNDQNEISYNEFISLGVEDACALNTQNIGVILELFSEFNKDPYKVNAEKKTLS